MCNLLQPAFTVAAATEFVPMLAVAKLPETIAMLLPIIYAVVAWPLAVYPTNVIAILDSVVVQTTPFTVPNTSALTEISLFRYSNVKAVHSELAVNVEGVPVCNSGVSVI